MRSLPRRLAISSRFENTNTFGTQKQKLSVN